LTLTLSSAASSSNTLKDSSLILKDLMIVFLLLVCIAEDLKYTSYLCILSS